MEVLFRIYDRLPRYFKKPIAFVAQPVYSISSRVFSFASKLRKPIFLLKGKEKNSGEPVNVLLFANKRTVYDFSNRLYDIEPSLTFLGKAFIWSIDSKAHAVRDRVDMTVIEAEGFFSRFLKRRGFFLLPQWVLLSLDISKSWKEIKKTFGNKSTKNNLRKMKKYNYSYEITRDSTKFDFFYREMYLPYAKQRFGEASLILGHRQMSRALNKGWLLLVRREEEALGGGVLTEFGRDCFAHSLGIKNGNIKYLEQGVLTATYYFIFLWAKDAGFERIDFGYCRPFLRDGIFIYKKRWGMEVKKKKSGMGSAVFGIKFNTLSEGVLSFLCENPFIFKNEEELIGFIAIKGKQALTSEELHLLMRIHDINGLDCMTIINPLGFSQEAQEWAALSSPRKLRLLKMNIETFFEKLTDKEHPVYLYTNDFESGAAS